MLRNNQYNRRLFFIIKFAKISAAIPHGRKNEEILNAESAGNAETERMKDKKISLSDLSIIRCRLSNL